MSLMLYFKLFTAVLAFEIHQLDSLTYSLQPGNSALGQQKIRPGVKAPCTLKVLVVLSSANTFHLMNGESISTGNFFNEVMIPSMAIKNAGFDLVYANPKGNAPFYSGEHKIFFNTKDVFEQAEDFATFLRDSQSMRNLSSIRGDELNGFSALFIPGGNSVLEDLWHDEDVGRILRHFHSAGKLTATVCNAAITLLAARQGDMWPYKGYRMTVFSNAEWKVLQGKLFSRLPRNPPETELRDNGAIIEEGFPGGSHIVRDRELVTGQNPFSSQELAQYLVVALQTVCSKLGVSS